MSVSKLLSIALPVSLLAACDPAPVRYKMTVEVETPDGPKSGSAVREVRYRPDRGGWFPLGESRARYSLDGEAVAVDLGPGRTLFALLSSAPGDSDYARRIPDRMMGSVKGGPPRSEAVTIWPPAHPEGVPLLVRFRDPNDSKSVEIVRPEALGASFGPGVSLKRISVQATGEPVTENIRKRLTWLGRSPEPSLDPGHGPDDWSPAATIHHGDFLMRIAT
jgi:hypothetical protein